MEGANMDYNLSKSIVLFLLNIPPETKKCAMDLYMEWQAAGGRVYDPDELIYILYYFDQMKNYDRQIMKEIAEMDGFLRK